MARWLFRSSVFFTHFASQGTYTPMTLLAPGANADLPQTSFTLAAHHGGLAGADIDMSAFLVGTNGRVRSDADMCFYGQPSAENNAVVQRSTDAGGALFEIDTARMPPSVDKIVITATIHENKATFSRLAGVDIDAGGVKGRIPCTGMEETALILAEIYRRGTQWKLRIVGQGFKGGLAALATHLGVDLAKEESSPPPVPEAPSRPVSLSKVVLTKSGASSKISLDKPDSGCIRVIATWVDNGDGQDNNDDLDLRAGILMPDGSMHWLAASHPGSLTKAPFARHLGDVREVSRDAPGTEIIEVDPRIAQRTGGPVALVFSVYSAVSNGAVSVASLHPVMRVEHAGQTVECAYSFPGGKAANNVYTYVIGTITIDGDSLDVQLSGATSPAGSEKTPWIARTAKGLQVSFDGPPVFKEGNTLAARLLGVGSKKYSNL